MSGDAQLGQYTAAHYGRATGCRKSRFAPREVYGARIEPAQPGNNDVGAKRAVGFH